VIDLREEKAGAFDSMSVNSELPSNEIDESELELRNGHVFIISEMPALFSNFLLCD
jgi:hypothetical protein